MRRTLARIAKLSPLVLALAVFGAHGDAEAAPPKGPKDANDFQNGGYLFLVPGGASVAWGGGRAGRADNDLDPSFKWGVGGGYLYAPKSPGFMASFGGRFEHVLHNLDWNETDDVSAWGHGLRIGPEIKLGGGIDWIQAYGIIYPGLVANIVNADSEGDRGNSRLLREVDDDLVDCDGNPNNDDTECTFGETQIGFNMAGGIGAVVLVYKGLGVGAEAMAHFAFLDDDSDPWRRWYSADFNLIVGWWF